MTDDPALTRRTLLRAGAAGGAALLGGGGAVLLGGCGDSEPKRRVPTVPVSVDGMNVVLIALDTLRADHVGAYRRDGIRPDNAVHTPAIDELCRQGLRFSRARPEALPTGPTRRSTFSGERVFPMRDWRPDPDSPAIPGWKRPDAEQQTLDQVLRKAGYRTAIVTDNTWLLKPSWARFMRGFDDTIEIPGQEYQRLQPGKSVRGVDVDRFMEPGLARKKASKVRTHRGVVERYLANQSGRRREEDWSVSKVFDRATSWLERHGKGPRPFFLCIDSYDPHEPWDPPAKDVARYDDPDYDGVEPISPLYGGDDYLTDRLRRRQRALYAGEITLADRRMGNFLQRLDELNLAERTLVVLYSDHGHSLSDRGLVGKQPSQLYAEMVDVPLVLRHPEGLAAGRTSDFLAQLHDLAPTITGTAGHRAPDAWDGIDLSPIFGGGDPERRREIQTAGYGEYVWASDGRMTYISSNRGKNRKLFDREEDPREQRNLAEDRSGDAERFWEAVVDAAGGEPLPRY